MGSDTEEILLLSENDRTENATAFLELSYCKFTRFSCYLWHAVGKEKAESTVIKKQGQNVHSSVLEVLCD